MEIKKHIRLRPSEKRSSEILDTWTKLWLHKTFQVNFIQLFVFQAFNIF